MEGEQTQGFAECRHLTVARGFNKRCECEKRFLNVCLLMKKCQCPAASISNHIGVAAP